MKGKNALITGAARGLGKAIAIGLAKRGADIIINDVESANKNAAKTTREIKALGVKCYTE
jgi:3-oxoacyl-[acyl-carrier protein] reductase